MITCHECSSENFDGAMYCESCGADFSGILNAEYPSEQDFISVGGNSLKLVLTDTGEEITFSEKEEILIGREDPVSAVFPDIDTSLYNGEEDGVSRKHARIFQQGNDYFVEDLESVNSTFLNKIKLDPKTPAPIVDGDELMLGRLKFRVALS
jgi:hypothetical protein